MREPPIWEKPIFELTADIAADSANRKSCQPTISELREYGDAACCSGPLVGTKSPLARILHSPIVDFCGSTG